MSPGNDAAPGRATRGRRTTKSIAADLLNHSVQAEVLSADDRRERELLEELLNRGYRIAVRCTQCGSWLVADRSVREHVGPVCRDRLGGDAA